MGKGSGGEANVYLQKLESRKSRENDQGYTSVQQPRKAKIHEVFCPLCKYSTSLVPSLLGTRLVFNHERYVAEEFNSGIHNFARSLLGLAEIVWLLDVYPAYI